MREAIDDVLALRAPDLRGLRRVMTWSFAVHVGVLLLLVIVPRDWLVHERPAPRVITISLGASAGPRSTGATPIGGRPVEKATPEPKRPEPIKPAAPKSDAMTVPKTATPPKPAKPVEEKPKVTPQPPARVTRPPTTGKEVTTGTSLAETGTKGQGTGLTVGGGSGAEATADVAADFCCRDYLQQVLDEIGSHWRSDLGERGTTVIRFTILPSGAYADITLEQSSGRPLLDRQAEFALQQARSIPLPPEYTEQKLTIHLRFPYEIR